MSDFAIQVENLSKLYHIGKRRTYKTARESMMNALSLPARLLRGRKDDPETELWALRDVSFTVPRGEVVGIIGRNGAGKSTLLKVLSRITEPTAGKITLKGRVGSLLEVGTGFHPELTGRENIYLNGAILGMRRAEIVSKFDEIVAFSEVEKFIDTPVKHYSSGMYTRLAFSVAAHLTPEILIVDEVLAVGDAAFQRKCIGRMQDVAEQGRTVLLVSHNMAVIRSLCRTTVLLENGRCVDSGDPDKVIGEYLARHSYGVNRDSEGWIDVSLRPDGSTAMIQRARVISADGSTTTAIRMGSGLRLEMDVSGFSSAARSQIGFIVKSTAGQWLAMINTGMKPAIIEGQRSHREIVTFEMPSFPFVPGQYFIDLSIAVKGLGRLDYVENAIQIEVIESDFYGTGHQQTSKDGVVFLDGDWRISPASVGVAHG